MILTDTAKTTDAGTVRRRVLGTSVDAAVCAVMAGPAQAVAAYRTTAELRASSFGGHVWLRTAAIDAPVPTTQGHPTWSPPT